VNLTLARQQGKRRDAAITLPYETAPGGYGPWLSELDSDRGNRRPTA